MEKLVTIRCNNNGKELDVPIGTTLEEIYKLFGLNMEYGPVSAKVNNKVEGMHYRVYRPKNIEFLDMHSPSGMRAYTRTLFFILAKAAHDIFPECRVKIDIPVSNGYYVDLEIGRKVTEKDVEDIKQRMQEIIDADLPIHRYETTVEEAIKMFRKVGSHTKIKLLESTGTLYTVYYDLDGYIDYYYGTLLTKTGGLKLYGLVKYFDGVLLRVPTCEDPSKLGKMIRQDKMFEMFREHHRIQEILEMSTVGDLNEAIKNGHSKTIVMVGEAMQEKKLSQIAEEIASRKKVRMVLIAGPSSSGKTTSCKRLSVQLVTNGLRPVPISLDDYFTDRENTPRDAKGDYDYEHLHALNIPLLTEQLKALFAGEEVELPRYNFQQGRSEWSGKKLRLREDDILVVEGIHALNPELTANIPEEQKFRVYASALTTMLLDSHNYIPTTDNRLLRRIIRDYKYRGCDARETIRRWASVRAGENKWIFPYQENADVMFNTAMLFELAVIKKQAEPLLEQVPENCPEYSEAYRLRKFLKYFSTMSDEYIPSTSLLKEFLGGSAFDV